jgi:uncharacterized protein (TIGR00730 family)
MSQSKQSICVFCASASGTSEVYAAATREFARAAVERGLRVVYGGASVGLMGVLADAVLGMNGEVVGVIPGALVDREIAHRGLTELHVVGTMHQRKAMMAQLADAFVALPGGLGTLEELFEVDVGAARPTHKTGWPVEHESVLRAAHRLLDHARDEGFVRREQRRASPTRAAALLDQLISTS